MIPFATFFMRFEMAFHVEFCTEGLRIDFTTQIQLNLCITTTLGTQNLWLLLTGGRCSEFALCYEN